MILCWLQKHLVTDHFPARSTCKHTKSTSQPAMDHVIRINISHNLLFCAILCRLVPMISSAFQLQDAPLEKVCLLGGGVAAALGMVT